MGKWCDQTVRFRGKKSPYTDESGETEKENCEEDKETNRGIRGEPERDREISNADCSGGPYRDEDRQKVPISGPLGSHQ